MFPCYYECGERKWNHWVERPRRTADGSIRQEIWSGSYGLHAKGNQFFKNLGAPPLPVVWISRPGLPAILDSSYNKHKIQFFKLHKLTNYLSLFESLRLLYFFCYLLNVPMLLWVWREKVKPLSRASAEDRRRVDPARNMIGIIWATRKR